MKSIIKDICIIVVLAALLGGLCSLALHLAIAFMPLLSVGYIVGLGIIALLIFFAIEEKIKDLWKKLME